MIAVMDVIIREGKESMTCLECHGTGIVYHWSEFAFFDDRRYCNVCDAGRLVEKTVSEIIKQAEAGEYQGYNRR
ncbi:MAG TPA: hypothetical protein VE262_21260 [Blastocatellia bacterium]|nr:hypothetical protein [Blastocatellia bacterium]